MRQEENERCCSGVDGRVEADDSAEATSRGSRDFSCVDNDDAGRRFEKENGFVRPKGVIEQLDKQGFKDWNELLVSNPAIWMHTWNGSSLSRNCWNGQIKMKDQIWRCQEE